MDHIRWYLFDLSFFENGLCDCHAVKANCYLSDFWSYCFVCSSYQVTKKMKCAWLWLRKHTKSNQTPKHYTIIVIENIANSRYRSFTVESCVCLLSRLVPVLNDTHGLAWIIMSKKWSQKCPENSLMIQGSNSPVIHFLCQSLFRNVERFQKSICFFKVDTFSEIIALLSTLKNFTLLIRLPGTVLNKLNAWQLEIFTKVPLKGFQGSERS